MVKHTHHHTCESALFYKRSVDLIASQCPFRFYHNRSVTPSVLDGGSQLVLANVKVGHSHTCDPQCLHILPTSTYTLTSREILCNCTLQSDLAYLPSDLGACNATTLKPPYSIACGKLRLAIWDTCFRTFWLKFGHKAP